MKHLSQVTATTFRTIVLALISIAIAAIGYALIKNIIAITSSSDSQLWKLESAYFIDTTNDKNPDDIFDLLGTFSPIAIHKVPYALEDQTYWLKLKITNSKDYSHQLILQADNSLIDVFNIYDVSDTLNITPIAVATNKLAKVYPHILFKLDANQSKQFLIQIRTQGPPNVPIIVKTEKQFTQHILFSQIIFGAFIGIILLMTIYNLILYYAVHDKVYVIYIGYLLCSFWVLSSVNGFGYLIFPTEISGYLYQYLIFGHYLLVTSLLAFTLYFLRYDQENNKTFKFGLMLCCSLIILGTALTRLSLIEQAKIFFALQPLVYLFALFAVVRKIKTNFSWAKFYVLSWFPLLAGATIQPLVLLNIIEYSFVTKNAFLLAILLELALMAFALAERMRRHEQDRLLSIAYHMSSGLPRKSNIEDKINHLIQNKSNDFSVLVIKPEHIDKVILHIDDDLNTQLFKRLHNKLTSLFKYNDAILTLTDKQDKLCFINNNAFAAIIDNKRTQQPLSTLVNSIQQIVQDNFQLNELSLPIKAVVGVATFPQHGEKTHQLINNAMLSVVAGELTQEKWAIYEPLVSQQKNEVLTLASELKQAMANNDLTIHHQPQVDLRTLRVCSSECLLRWHHPEKGLIPPTIFIPIAEDMGLINELTLWVIKTALAQQNVIMHEQGFNHMVSINISGKDLASNHFLVNVLDIIEASDVPTDKIIFELTESASFTDNKQALHVISQLSELGITISIDDFGTGYSSMSQVGHLPFQELKVDREFVENINDNPKQKVIAKATVSMAKGLGLEVVAEGINSKQDEQTLREFGCDIGQGYYYAKPMAFEYYLDWLSRLDQGRVAQPIEGEFLPASK
ncbi:EAL domain-containing protein [Thalassotalea marina]|uniref:EAL domain-containing protein n=1 Tax=Thalassotalea marina TaxID=1673741 RepID=A0A919BJ12_9GAMM|nr:EAL domain-containing protein [Thalassotalea marina]GHF93440.1 hypothetical protein GCM10017161_22260 [Thalassotalea marina]